MAADRRECLTKKATTARIFTRSDEASIIFEFSTRYPLSIVLFVWHSPVVTGPRGSSSLIGAAPSNHGVGLSQPQGPREWRFESRRRPVELIIMAAEV